MAAAARATTPAAHSGAGRAAPEPSTAGSGGVKFRIRMSRVGVDTIAPKATSGSTAKNTQCQLRVSVSQADGTLLRTSGPCYLCRCGGSKSKPFCDATHGLKGFDGTETAVSHAMRLLRPAGVVRNRRDGRMVYYRLADDRVRALLELTQPAVTGR